MARECLTQCELYLVKKEVTERPGLPTEGTEWSCCWCLRENSQRGRRLCSLSVYHWQRAAACVIDSFTNQLNCSSTKRQGSLPVYSLNRPKSTDLPGWLPTLSLSLFYYLFPLPLNELSSASVSLYAPFIFRSFIPSSPTKLLLVSAETCRWKPCIPA